MDEALSDDVVAEQSRPSRILPLHIAGFLSACIYLSMVLCSEDTWMPISIYLLSMLALWSIFLVTWKYLRLHIGAIFIWAVLIRIIAFCDLPLYEDDFNRYQWDGYVFLQEGSPYDRAPDTYFDDASIPDEWADILSDVNNPDIPTVYGPVAMYVFACAAFIGDHSFYVAKFCIVIFEIYCLWLLSRLLSARHFLLYAWMPLLIQEVWMSGHTDAIALPFLLTSVLAYQQQQSYRSALLFALAVCARLQLIVLAPLFLIGVLHKPRVGINCIGLFLACAFCMYAPFLLQGSWSGLDITWMFIQEWHFNAFILDVFAWVLPDSLARYLLLCFCAVVYVRILWRLWMRADGFIQNDIVLVLIAVLLCGSCINAWYMICVLPFIACRPQFISIGFCLLLPLSYIHGISLQGDAYAPYEVPFFVIIIEAVFICVMLILDRFYKENAQNLSTQLCSHR